MCKMTTLLSLLFILVLNVSQSHAWLIYHKPEFSGKVIDTETKKPIEGAVVVAVYNKSTIGLGAGTISSIISVQEALTDKDGMFHIPSYTTLIQPFSWEIGTAFIIFKPGYVSISGLNLEECLSGGMFKESELPWLYNQQLKYKISSGVVELPKLKTREERNKASMIGVSGYRSKDLPLLYKAINEEDRYLGIPERE